MNYNGVRHGRCQRTSVTYMIIAGASAYVTEITLNGADVCQDSLLLMVFFLMENGSLKGGGENQHRVPPRT